MSRLFVVATPIGNLEDLSPRAAKTLREVSLIAAEDTRVTRQLLSHFDIHTPLAAFTDAYSQRQPERMQRVLDVLNSGEDVALVSDAGMPGLSDPGYMLIRTALVAGHRVEVVPGPSAITTALVASGLPADRFLFVGFLPRKAGERRALYAELAAEPGTIVAFEAPHRLLDALDDLVAILGDRSVAVARELTKRFEETWRGPASEARAYYAQHIPRGEITLVIAGVGRQRATAGWPESEVRKGISLLAQEGLPPPAIARVLARLSAWPRADVYSLAVGADRSEA
jgi:16S rRNA (cytidine1402-2'-O)-methyltransferase